MAETTTFNYTISDGFTSSTAVVTVNIADAEVVVVAQNDSGPAFNTTQGALKNHPVLANDSPTGVIVDAITVAPNQGGTAAIVSGGGSINYTPASGFTGTETYTYRARHLSGPSTDTAIVTIQVASSGGGGSPNRSGLPWPSGVTDGALSQITPFGSWRGRPIDVTIKYPGGSAWGKGDNTTPANTLWSRLKNVGVIQPNNDMHDILAAGIDVVYCMAMLTNPERGQFRQIAGGARDADHDAVAQTIASWYNGMPSSGRGQLWMCYGQEVSGSGTGAYPWKYNARSITGQNASDYIAAYRHVVDIYRNRINGLKVTWNTLRNANDAAAHYPGNGWIDAITIDGYDNGDNNSWFASSAEFSTWLTGNLTASGFSGFKACRDFARSKGKPWGIQEWGPTWEANSSGGCPTATNTPNNTFYMDGMWAFLNDPANSIDCAMEVFFQQGSPVANCGVSGLTQQHTIHPRQNPLTKPSQQYYRRWHPNPVDPPPP